MGEMNASDAEQDRDRAQQEPATPRPSEDPVRVERSQEATEGGESGDRRGQSMENPDGTSNVLPPEDPEVPMPPPEERELGTAEDPAARPLEAEAGRDNIREGRGGGTANPSLAEGGEGGEGG